VQAQLVQLAQVALAVMAVLAVILIHLGHLQPQLVWQVITQAEAAEVTM
jgi:hypothetical protein